MVIKDTEDLLNFKGMVYFLQLRDFVHYLGSIDFFIYV